MQGNLSLIPREYEKTVNDSAMDWSIVVVMKIPTFNSS